MMIVYSIILCPEVRVGARFLSIGVGLEVLFLGEFQFVSDLCGKLSGDNFFRGDNFFWRVVYSGNETVQYVRFFVLD